MKKCGLIHRNRLGGGLTNVELPDTVFFTPVDTFRKSLDTDTGPDFGRCREILEAGLGISKLSRSFLPSWRRVCSAEPSGTQ